MYTRRMRLIRPLTLSLQYNRLNRHNKLLLYISADKTLQAMGAIPFWGWEKIKSTTTTNFQL